MRFRSVVILAILGEVALLTARAQAPSAQAVTPTPPPAAAAAPAPPPPPVAITGPSATRSSHVQSIIRGPWGEVQALVLSGDTTISIPPDLGAGLAALTRGEHLSITGIQPAASQGTIVAQSIQWKGQTLTAAAPPAPAGGTSRNPRPGAGLGPIAGPRARPGPPPPPAAYVAPPPASGAPAATPDSGTPVPPSSGTAVPAPTAQPQP